MSRRNSSPQEEHLTRRQLRQELLATMVETHENVLERIDESTDVLLGEIFDQLSALDLEVHMLSVRTGSIEAGLGVLRRELKELSVAMRGKE